MSNQHTHIDDSPPSPVLPITYDPLPPETYYGLLTDPVGRYGRVPYGGTTAVTLRGDSTFRRRAANLFDSFGGESVRPILGDDGEEDGFRLEARPIVLRPTDHVDIEFFCLPPTRIKTALRLYLYGQLWKHKGDKTRVVDDEGDFVEITCSNEDALMVEATHLSEVFYETEMTSDYAAIPALYHHDGADIPPQEHAESRRDEEDLIPIDITRTT